MSDPLSIAAAARDAAASVALIAGAQCFTYAEMAQLASARAAQLAGPQHTPLPLVGTNTIETLVTLYALLELRRPVLLLHPRLTATERAQEIEATVQAGATLPDDAAAILYTSGTTGRARGAVLTRAALLASAAASAANLGWQDDDRWLLAMPLARIGGLSIITRCLAARRTVVLEPGFDAETLPESIEAHRVTLLSLVPTMLALLLQAHPTWRAPPRLRALLVGGAAAPPLLLAQAAARRLPIVATYGCTESCSQVVATPYTHRYESAAWTAGRPLTGADVRIDDGRILVRGPMLMSGYLGEPPLVPGAWFDTGDVGELDATGALQVYARRADLIVSGGENVYPAEVEAALEACPGIRTAAVFGIDDPVWGQVVAALLVAEPGAAGTLEQSLHDHMACRLAPHKRPRRIAFVPSLPLTPAGKLDRSALPRVHARPAAADVQR